MKKLILLISALCLLCGCASYGNVSKNLADDGAIIKAKIGTPWGIQDIIRIGETTNSVVVSPDGTISINPPSPAKK